MKKNIIEAAITRLEIEAELNHLDRSAIPQYVNDKILMTKMDIAELSQEHLLAYLFHQQLKLKETAEKHRQMTEHVAYEFVEHAIEELQVCYFEHDHKVMRK